MRRERIWFERSRWRWLRWPMLCVGSIAVGLLLVEFVNWLIKPPPEAQVVRFLATSSADSASAAAPAASDALMAVALTPASPAPSGPAKAASSAAETAACREPFSMQRPSASSQSRHAAAAKASRERVRSVLQSRGDESMRAVAWYLDDARNDLARLAGGSTEPTLYMLAMRSCQGRVDGNCQLVTPQGWSERDPANAVPWLWQAALAEQRGDAAAADEALRRAGQAGAARDGRHLALQAVLTSEVTREWMASYQLLHFARDVMSKEAARGASLDAFVRVPRVCGASALTRARGEVDTGRQAACVRVADVLVTQGDSLALRRAGLAIGEANGWAASRVAQVKGELDAMAAAFEPPHLEFDAPGCDAVRKALPALARMATRGEIEFASQAVKERAVVLTAVQVTASAAAR